MATNISGINPSGTPTALDSYGAAEQAISFKEQLPDLASKLREALTTKFNESPLFKQRETAMQNFLAAPSAINADLASMQKEGKILSPNQQQEISGARRAAEFAPLNTTNMMLGTLSGGMENMVEGGTKAFEAASQGMTERANLLNKMREQEIERQFKEEEMKLKWASLNTSQAKTATKELQKTQDALQGLNETIQAINNARNAVQSGGGGLSAILAGARKRIPSGWLGSLSGKDSSLDSALATVNQSIFKTAGKAFTGTEAQILGGRVPKVSYQPDQINIILDELEREALSRQLAILGGTYQIGGESDASEWDIVQ